MAADAVYKIKETEDKGKASIKKANEEAKQILSAARTESAAKKQEVIDGALQEKAALIQSAVAKANKSCEEINSQGEAERKKLLAPEGGKLDSAIQLVMERIVSVDGNR